MLNIPSLITQAKRALFGAATDPAIPAVSAPPPVTCDATAELQEDEDSDAARWASLERARFVYVGAASQQPVPATLTHAYTRTRQGHRVRLLTVPGTDINALVAPDYASGKPRVVAVFSHVQAVHPSQFRVQAWGRCDTAATMSTS